MKDRIPKYAGRIKLVPVDEANGIYDMVRADEPIEEGTPLNKSTLLTDETANLAGLDENATVEDVLNLLITILYNKTVGLEYELDGDTYVCVGIGTATDNQIVIASMIDGKKVVSIGNAAFRKNNNISSVIIQNGVESIGDEAFEQCALLTIINIPNSVTSIGNSAFDGCSSLTNIKIPNSVTSIGDNAFAVCASLTSITIPNSVTSIGNGAFGICTSLTSITIGDSVTSIGEAAFSYCIPLTSITIPNSVTSIGISTFVGCENLTDIYVPWAEGAVPNAPWGATNATIHYNSEV